MQINSETGEVYAESPAIAPSEEIVLMTLTVNPPRYEVICWGKREGLEDHVRWSREFYGDRALSRAILEYNRWAKVPEQEPLDLVPCPRPTGRM